MTKAIKTIIYAAVTGWVLAGCASGGGPTAPPEDATPTTPTRTETPTRTIPAEDDPWARLDPSDNTDKENLDNPNSLLSRRVIYFDLDMSVIKPEFRPIVQAHAELLASHPEMNLVLEGHADERGTREYNLGLGERRGNSVGRAMDASGAAGNQLNIVSYGEERPVLTCSNEDCWSQNRRVEIVYR